MSAIFSLYSLTKILLLLICSCTYVHLQWPSILEKYNPITNKGNPNAKNKNSILSLFWKLARIGERASFYVSALLFAFGVSQLIS
jgi:hypothetical protein